MNILGIMFALAAGEFSIMETIFNPWSVNFSCAPIPKNFPEVTLCNASADVVLR